MGRLFDREVVLNAGGLRIASRSVEGLAQPTLRVQFKVVKSLKRDPNTATVTITNLNGDNRAALQEKGIPTILEAGYVDNVSQIFAGVLQFGSSVKNGTDFLTTIQTGDGGDKYKTARINTSLKGPVDIKSVLQTAGEALGLNLGNLREKISQGSLRPALQEMTEGVVLSGKAEQVFTRIAKQMGYSWSIQDGQIQLLAPNEVIATSDAVLLTAVDGRSTGLIGSPEPGEKGIVKARSLLQPDLLPGRKVQIQSREIDGFFRVEKAVFTGDTWGSDWYSDIEAKPL
jgi:hypothetical protein